MKTVFREMNFGNELMLISVIIPVYNVEKYLRKCLDSLLQQTFKDIEVIMVDDGSTDSSGKICDEYVSQYGNFKVIHKNNEGLGMARNTGLDNMSGDYVCFVDSDDYLDSSAIEILYKELVKYKVDMSKSGFRRVLDNGEVLSSRHYSNELFKGEEFRNTLLPRMIGSSPSQHDSVEMCVTGAIYNVEPIIKYDIRFPSERELISEDLVFNIDYAQYANGGCLISDIAYNYRVNVSSLTKSYRKNRFEASKHFYLEMRGKLTKLNYCQDVLVRLDRLFFVYVKVCIAQEKSSSAYHNRSGALKEIESICSDKVLREAILNYPIKQLGYKQSLFLYLIRFKAKRLLLLLAEKGLL